MMKSHAKTRLDPNPFTPPLTLAMTGFSTSMICWNVNCSACIASQSSPGVWPVRRGWLGAVMQNMSSLPVTTITRAELSKRNSLIAIPSSRCRPGRGGRSCLSCTSMGGVKTMVATAPWRVISIVL